MRSRSYRRTFIVGAAIAAIAGCLDDRSDSGNAVENGTQSPDSDRTDNGGGSAVPECDLSNRTDTGRGDPVESATTRRNGSTDVDEVCATIAGEVALDHLDDRLDVNLDDAPWIYAGYVYDGTYAARVTVHTIVDGEDGTAYECPDPSFDVETALNALPSEVQLTLHSEDGNVLRECTHEISLRQVTLYED